MNIHVYDTKVLTVDGQHLHFDVLIEQQSSALAITCATTWLTQMGLTATTISQDNCQYCHSEEPPPEISRHIQQQGFFVIQLEGCPAFV